MWKCETTHIYNDNTKYVFADKSLDVMNNAERNEAERCSLALRTTSDRIHWSLSFSHVKWTLIHVCVC